MQAACDLARKRSLSLLSGMQSRWHNGYRECIRRIHDGAIGDVVAMQVMFLRGPYQTVTRNPAYTETQYQFSNWYHFCWLSGDDVTQSLVHNMDRAAWILKEEMPQWCFGLGGRSASYGELYGDMFDHHTVVYEYASGRGSTPSAARRTTPTATRATSSWAPRAAATSVRTSTAKTSGGSKGPATIPTSTSSGP